jgi:hypothetical protein
MDDIYMAVEITQKFPESGSSEEKQNVKSNKKRALDMLTDVNI